MTRRSKWLTIDCAETLMNDVAVVIPCFNGRTLERQSTAALRKRARSQKSSLGRQLNGRAATAVRWGADAHRHPNRGWRGEEYGVKLSDRRMWSVGCRRSSRADICQKIASAWTTIRTSIRHMRITGIRGAGCLDADVRTSGRNLKCPAHATMFRRRLFDVLGGFDPGLPACGVGLLASRD